MITHPSDEKALEAVVGAGSGVQPQKAGADIEMSEIWAKMRWVRAGGADLSHSC